MGRSRKIQRTVSVEDLILSWASTRVGVANTRRVRSRKKLMTISAIVILAVIAFPIVFDELSTAAGCVGVEPAPSDRGVALIDQLSLRHPNPTFIDSVRSAVMTAGYSFTYYSHESVTLELLKRLPAYGFGIIILRAHSTQNSIVVSDSYSQFSNVGNQLRDRIIAVEADGYLHFGITPGFVADSMCGTFPGTIILAMGCRTLSATNMAQSFVQRGAIGFAGWSGLVTLAHSDSVFSTVVDSLVAGNSLEESLKVATSLHGVDPIWKTQPSLYAET